jgi:TM2 domain-containing membrane protein YozV
MALIICPDCKNTVSNQAVSCTKCGYPIKPQIIKGSKSKFVATMCAFFLGGFGIHKLYLNNVGQFLIYLCLSWSFIPAILGVIEAFMYAFMSEEDFQKKYC